mmetsp:Transcript_42830/g.134998  ORF Transcript_42830/g.134998 Transcript_42830/m.134998 type:complete len:204 (-) Transcript_42830:1546-2157(-)
MLRSEVQYLMETLDCHSPQLHSFLISEFGSSRDTSFQTLLQRIRRIFTCLLMDVKVSLPDSKDDCTVNTIAVEEMFHEGMKAHDMVGSAVCMLPEQYNEVEMMLRQHRARLQQLFATFESLKSKLTDELRTASRSACGRLMAERDEILRLLRPASDTPAEIQLQLDDEENSRKDQRARTVVPPAKPSKSRFVRQTIRNKSKAR